MLPKSFGSGNVEVAAYGIAQNLGKEARASPMSQYLAAGRVKVNLKLTCPSGQKGKRPFPSLSQSIPGVGMREGVT